MLELIWCIGDASYRYEDGFAFPWIMMLSMQVGWLSPKTYPGPLWISRFVHLFGMVSPGLLQQAMVMVIWLDAGGYSHSMARQAGLMAWVGNICSQWRMVPVTAGLIPIGLVEIKCHVVMIKVNLAISSCFRLWCIILLFLLEVRGNVLIGFAGCCCLVAGPWLLQESNPNDRMLFIVNIWSWCLQFEIKYVSWPCYVMCYAFGLEISCRLTCSDLNYWNCWVL